MWLGFIPLLCITFFFKEQIGKMVFLINYPYNRCFLCNQEQVMVDLQYRVTCCDVTNRVTNFDFLNSIVTFELITWDIYFNYEISNYYLKTGVNKKTIRFERNMGFQLLITLKCFSSIKTTWRIQLHTKAKWQARI